MLLEESPFFLSLRSQGPCAMFIVDCLKTGLHFHPSSQVYNKLYHPWWSLLLFVFFPDFSLSLPPLWKFILSLILAVPLYVIYYVIITCSSQNPLYCCFSLVLFSTLVAFSAICRLLQDSIDHSLLLVTVVHSPASTLHAPSTLFNGSSLSPLIIDYCELKNLQGS